MFGCFAGADWLEEELRTLIPVVVVELMNLLAFFQGIRFFLKSCLTISRAAFSISRPRSLQILSSETSVGSPEAAGILEELALGFYSPPVPQRLQQ